MITGIIIRKNQYYDSVFLMGFNNRLSKVEGVIQTAVLMASDANKEVLADLGFVNAEVKNSTANDLVVGVTAISQEVLDNISRSLDLWLVEVSASRTTTGVHTLEEAITIKPDSDLVVISVPGEFAARETKKALEAGKHVFLFSDNVSVNEEISLKTFAQSRGLLVMGPDCGTSLIGGIGIGFANAVRKGKIGVIAAAGTGLQEFTCMVHNAGYGISHGIGTGGRDLSDAVGGLTTISALDALEQDSSTQVIVILSKPPGEKTLKKLVERIHACAKPVVCCFLGISRKISGEGVIFQRATIIDDAVRLAIKAIGGEFTQAPMPDIVLKPIQLQKGKFLRGVFAGGTFCYQTQQILRDAGIEIYSNAALDKNYSLEHPNQSKANTIIDMGDEFFMVGRPHPMINGSQRAIRILKEAEDPTVGILLLDFILGYNASMDPVGELVDAIQKAKLIALNRGDNLQIVASICGTNGDPQDLALQTRILEECGVLVFTSNAQAAHYCASQLVR
ncbi:MAG: acyl-CoA synthetase FdrA [Anaerolineaceae bacterium]